MTVWRRVVRVFVVVSCLAAVGGCGSESTGRANEKAVLDTVREYGGPDARTYASQLIVQDADDGKFRSVPVITVCRAAGGCVLIAPDGVSYPSLRDLIDDTKFVGPGDSIIANANMATPDAPVKPETFRKAPDRFWYWIGGGVAVVVVALVVLWLIGRKRRRAEEERLLHEWTAPETETNAGAEPEPDATAEPVAETEPETAPEPATAPETETKPER